MSAPAADPEWAAGVQRLHDEAAGVVHLDVVRQTDMPRLILAGLGGNVEAGRLLLAVTDALRRIQCAPADAPMECACCGKALKASRYSIVVVQPAVNDPADRMTMAICGRCGPTVGAIKAAATRSLQSIWPNVRPIEITHSEGGRA